MAHPQQERYSSMLFMSKYVASLERSTSVMTLLFMEQRSKNTTKHYMHGVPNAKKISFCILIQYTNGQNYICMVKFIFLWAKLYFRGQIYIPMGKIIFAWAILIFAWAKLYFHGQITIQFNRILPWANFNSIQ